MVKGFPDKHCFRFKTLPAREKDFAAEYNVNHIWTLPRNISLDRKKHSEIVSLAIGNCYGEAMGSA